MTREEWLHLAAERFCWPLILANGVDARPVKVRLSVGFPVGSRGGTKVIGQCWAPEASADGSFEIFISPKIDAKEALRCLLHELIHAAVGVDKGHNGPFKKVAVAVGFQSPMKYCPAGLVLAASFEMWLAALPPFPGAQMEITGESSTGKKRAGSRLLKVFCPQCDYTMRVTQKWIEVGKPTCPNSVCDDYGLEMSHE